MRPADVMVAAGGQRPSARRRSAWVGVYALVAALLGGTLLFGGCARNTGNLHRTWTVKRTDIILELRPIEGERCRMPAGVYSLDPYAASAKPVLLIPGGSRPAWSPKRDCFVYMSGSCLWRAHCSGKTEELEHLSQVYCEPDSPAVRWMQGGGLVYLSRDRSRGTSVLIPHDAVRSVSPQRSALSQGRSPARPNDTWIARSADSSPDASELAVEAYPSALDDLERNRARILIYSTPIGDQARTEEGPVVLSIGPVSGAHRLTHLGPAACEMNPLWSPRGNWVAFTVVHLDGGYAAPAVCRPDGRDYTELLTEVFWHEGAHACLPIGWAKIAPTMRHSVDPDASNADKVSGGACAWPLEWSDDGRYLLINRGNSWTLDVATYHEGRWRILEVGCPPDTLVRGVLGPARDGVCAVAMGGRVAVYVTRIVVPGRTVSDGPRMIPMPKGLSVQWIDW